jgi:Protein of unknown function (DUF2934)
MASRRPTDSPRNPESSPSPEKSPSRRRSPTPRAKKTAVAATPPRIQISDHARRAMIAEAAYLRAERRGFAPGNEVEDWLSAEAEVDALLREDHTTAAQ